MKLNDYRQMMAYMRRPGFQNGTPQPKPQEPQRTFNEKIETFSEAAPFVMPRSGVAILKGYLDDALKDGEMTQEEHTQALMPLFGETGEMVTEQIEVSDRDNFYNGGRIGFYEAGYVKPQPQEYLDQARAYYGREFKDLPDANKSLIRSGRVKELLDQGKKTKMPYAEAAEYKDLIKEKVKASKKAGKPESYQSLYRFLKNKGYPITQEDIDAGYGRVNRAKSLINKALGNPVSGKPNQFAGGLMNYLTKDKTVLAKQSKASQAAVSKAIGKQPEILEFLLSNPDTDVKDIAEKFNLKKSNTRDQLKKILTRIYLSKEPDASTWVNSYTDEQLSTVVRNIRGLPSFKDDFEKRMTSLIQTAYKDKPRETYLKARKKYFDYSKAVRAISDKFGKAAEYNLDHIIPLDFLYKSKEGRNPMDLIRVRPTTRAVNTFKSRFDRAFIKIAKGIKEDPQNKKLQGQRKAFNDLSKALPPEFKLGEITPKGDFKSFKASPLSGTQSYLQAVKDAPIEQNILIDYLKENKDKPEFKNALKRAGMNPNQFIALAEKRKLPAKQISNFLDKQISKGNIEMFSKIPGITDLFNVAKSIPDDIKKSKYLTAGFKTLGIAATPLVIYDTYKAFEKGKPVLEALEQGLIGTNLIGSTKDFIALSPEEKEARSVVKQGEIREQITDDFSSLDTDFDTPNIKSDMSRQEAEKKYEEAKKVREMENAARDKQIAETRALAVGNLFDTITGQRFQPQPMPEQMMAVGGRVGYADGPEDPKKRKFIKLGVGLMSLPIIGKYLKFAAPVAEKTTEIIRRGADGIPDFIMDLIAKVKLKAEEKGMKYFTGNRSDEFADVYQADDFIVTEQGNKITIKKRKQEGDMLEKDMEMEIETDPETGGVTYNEATARPDAEGKLKDVEEYIDEIDLEDMKKYTYDE